MERDATSQPPDRQAVESAAEAEGLEVFLCGQHEPTRLDGAAVHDLLRLREEVLASLNVRTASEGDEEK